MTTGLVLGKFYPPHAGHHYVIDTALEQCDRVVICLLWANQESIPWHLRAQWLHERHPEAILVSERDDHPIDYLDPDVWDAHMSVILLGLRRRQCDMIDTVFSSEPYGEELAERLGADHVLVDIARREFPISGTAIRRDPARHWQSVTPPVRAWLTKRIVVIGAESTGTTTLTQDLASAYGMIWVPEYGRFFSEAMGREHVWQTEDLRHIATTQNMLEAEYAHRAGPLMFCDTDALATSVWHEFLVDEPDGPIAAPTTDRTLYLLTDLLPWEDDGTRIGEHFRDAMHERFKTILSRRSLSERALIRGTREERLERAMILVDAVLRRGWNFAEPLLWPGAHSV